MYSVGMGHHGTVVRIDAKWKASLPDAGTMVHLLVPSVCGHPVACVVESVADNVVTLRAMVSQDVTFIPGSPGEVEVDRSIVATGKVA
jgi:hypothetical protein